MSEPFETGDAVRHTPSGEVWQCGFVRDGFLYNNGWPLGITPVTEFYLVQKATPDQRRALLQRMAAMSDKSDPRRRYAQSVLDEVAP